MMRSNDIIKWINVQLLELFPRGKAYEVATTVRKDSGETMPVIDENYVGVDDTYSFISYHKQLTLTSAAVARSGFGDNIADLQNTYSNAIIIYYDQKKCGLTVDELYTFIQAKITGILKIDGYKQASINVSNAILNDSQVWIQEYGSKEFKLSGSQRLIQIGYSVVLTLDKNCITIPSCKN